MPPTASLPPKSPTARRYLWEAAYVYLAVTATVFVCTRFSRTSSGSEWVPVIVALVFLWVPIHFARKEQNGEKRFGIELGGLIGGPSRAANPLVDFFLAVRAALPSGLRETVFAVAIVAILFPVYMVGFYGWHHWVLDIELVPFRYEWPEQPWTLLLTQVLVVALPEEVFFRGYLHTRLEDAFPVKRRFLGTHQSLAAWALQAVLFALIHVVVDANLGRFAVIFPGLLFGWIRLYRGGVGAAIVVHALCNMLAATLAKNWF